MKSNKELQIAYRLAIVLLVVGVLSYSAFSAKVPDQPVRVMFKCVAGKILFDHKAHIDYGDSCTNCHHNLEEGETNPESCGVCHESESQDEDVPGRGDAFHAQCIGCHKDSGAGPGSGDKECGLCHVM